VVIAEADSSEKSVLVMMASSDYITGYNIFLSEPFFYGITVHELLVIKATLLIIYKCHCSAIFQSINQSINYFIVRLKLTNCQLSLPHLGITKTEKIELKHKTDKQIDLVNSL